MSRARTAVLIVTPAVGLATVALGLFVGARPELRAAVVYGAPQARGRGVIVWPILTLEEEYSSRTPVALEGVTVTARTPRGEFSWRGSTNADGAADVELSVGEILPQDAIDLVVTHPSSREPLAEGRAAREVELPRVPVATWLRFARRVGRVKLDVAIYGGRAAPGFPTEAWVRASRAATVRASGDGLTITPELIVVDASGWGRAQVTVTSLAPGLRLTVDSKIEGESDGGKVSEWVGDVPVALGADDVAFDAFAKPGAETRVVLTAPTPRAVAYLEVDDSEGRAFAAAVKLAPLDADSYRGEVMIPALNKGVYGVVVSNDPYSSATMGPTVIARPLVVSDSDVSARALLPSCTADMPIAGCLATTQTLAPARWIAIDGFVKRREMAGQKRANGRLVALFGLASAAIVEAALILEIVRTSRGALTGELARAAPRRRVLSIVVGLLLALLGFAFVGALVVRAL